MTTRVVSMSALSDTQFIIIGVAVLAALWYSVNKAGDVTNRVSDIIFGPKMDAPATLTPGAIKSMDEYIKMGYGYKDKNGVFRITPLGQMYIDRIAKQRG